VGRKEEIPVRRKLAAILSADVHGYSRLMGEDEVATVRTLTAHREVMSTLILARRGRVVDSPGDNLLAEFASVVDAVECAVEVQRELRSRNAQVPVPRRLEFRIGLNLGDVIVEGDRLYGDGVNIAARVEGLAEPGGVAISGTVYDQVKNRLALPYESQGEHVVKNIQDPVRVYRVGLEPALPGTGPKAERPAARRSWRPPVLRLGLALLVLAAGGMVWYLASRSRLPGVELPDKPSIAVLPFENMSGDSGQEYFSDGMTEDLITGLSKLSGLFVIARNSVFTYKGKPVRPSQVSRELGVRYVLEGSVRKAGNRVRITAQLIDATTGYHVWAERYDRDLTDVFALQDEVTQKIVGVLAVKLTAPERNRLGRTPTGNLEAYDHVLRGMEYRRRTTKEANAEAQKMFVRAVELDPKYAAAYAALGWALLQEWQFQWSRNPETLQRALELAQKAIAHDDSLAEPHSLLSQIYLWRKAHERAIAEAERAVVLAPNDADGYETLAEVQAWSGRADDAIRQIRRAMRLNPQYPFFYLWTLGHAYYLTGRNADAVATLEKVLERNPNFIAAHAILAVLYSEQGREQEARAHGATAARLSPQASMESLRQIVPYKNEKDLERFLTGMRKTGLK
jgi:adenylate cyclase